MLNKIIRYFLENRVITILILVLVVVWGISTSPFNWHGGIIPRNPIPVDAIPDIGDNQQIVATEWMGRSPKDIQDQITYPLPCWGFPESNRSVALPCSACPSSILFLMII